MANLERQGYPCYLPRMRVEKIRYRKLSIVTEPLFPRYLVVRLDTRPEGKGWAPIRSTLGVSRLVTFGGRAAKVDDALVAWLRDREIQLPSEALFHPGDTVVITEGPFVGLEAIYQTRDAEQRAILLLEILSKTLPLTIETAHVRKAG